VGLREFQDGLVNQDRAVYRVGQDGLAHRVCLDGQDGADNQEPVDSRAILVKAACLDSRDRAVGQD
jgi:hypothetical protein